MVAFSLQIVHGFHPAAVCHPVPRTEPPRSATTRSPIRNSAAGVHPLPLDEERGLGLVPITRPPACRFSTGETRTNRRSTRRATTGPVQANGRTIPAPEINVAPGKDGEVKIRIPNNTPAGTYSLVFRGTGKLTMGEPGTKKKRNATFISATGPVALPVYDTACVLKFAASPVAVRPGSQVDVPVTIERLHKYAGPLTVELVPPKGVGGLAASNVTVAAGASSAKLVLKSDKNTKPATGLTFLVRATARVGNASLKTEVDLPVNVAAAAEPGAPRADVKSVALVAGGAPGWRYSPAASGDAWRAANFDDFKWKEVKAPLGTASRRWPTGRGPRSAIRVNRCMPGGRSTCRRNSSRPRG